MGEGIWLRWKRFAARARNLASQVERARILLAYRNNLSFLAVGRTVGVRSMIGRGPAKSRRSPLRLRPGSRTHTARLAAHSNRPSFYNEDGRAELAQQEEEIVIIPPACRRKCRRRRGQGRHGGGQGHRRCRRAGYGQADGSMIWIKAAGLEANA